MDMSKSAQHTSFLDHGYASRFNATSRPAFPSPSEVSAASPLQWDNRNVSPSRASIQSTYFLHSTPSNITNSAGTGTQLKRKQGYKHMRQHLHLTRSLSSTAPINDPSPLLSSNPSLVEHSSPSQPSQPSRIHLIRANTAPSPKRARQSHSCCDVETRAVASPSLDSHPTNSQECIGRIERSPSTYATLRTERRESLQETPVVEIKSSIGTKPSSPATPHLVQSSPDTPDTQSVPTPTHGEELLNMDVRNEQVLGFGLSENGSKGSSESQKSEDLFLNIARVDSTRPSSSKGEKKRSRISLPFFSSARPATSYNSEKTEPDAESSLPTPRAEYPTYYRKRSSLQFGDMQGTDQVLGQESSDSPKPYFLDQRSSALNGDTIRAPLAPTTGVRNNRLVSEAGYVDKAKHSEQNATESTVSTTAPSTVWDELDDLKSRIRKLELTGKLPPSSAAAMSTAERPRTATTAATTMSSSPKHNKATTQLQSAIEGIPSTVHPLLHEALGNAKAVVSQDVYHKLQATAQDALQLASMTTFDGGSVRNAVHAMTERQIRRKTESMCRSLTELAIALAAESKPAQSAYRPSSRDHYISPNVGLRSRRYSQSNDTAERPPVSARVQSRLENRKMSTQYSYSTARHQSPELDSPTALPQYPASGSRVIRPSAQLRHRRAQGFVDGVNDEDDSNPSVRPASRAMTDVSAVRRLSRDPAITSREYTSQHPLPAGAENGSSARTPLPAHLSTNFISRRKRSSPANASEVDSSPLASRQSIGRISIVHHDNASSDTMSEAPPSGRSVSTRRSLGFASRLGSSVGSRLRAAKLERTDSRSYKESPISTLDEPLQLQTTTREQ